MSCLAVLQYYHHHYHVMTPLDTGHLITILTATFFLVASYVILFNAFLPPSGVYVRTRFFCKTRRSAYMNGRRVRPLTSSRKTPITSTLPCSLFLWARTL